ncbi:MAG: hypothetical protein RXR20_20570, partial [Paraburkholderia sp.]
MTTTTTTTPLVAATPTATPTPTPTPTYQPETATPITTRATSTGPMPSKQETLLNQIAGLALSYSQGVAPGQVNAQQQQVLSAWRNNADSDYSQFMANQGLSMVSSNPGVLFNEELATAQSQWSMQDAQGALSMLGLSAKDWDEYQKLKEEDEQRHDNFLFGAVETVAGAALTFFSAG